MRRGKKKERKLVSNPRLAQLNLIMLSLGHSTSEIILLVRKERYLFIES